MKAELNETEKAIAKQVEHTAKQEFFYHVLSRENETTWLCHKPKHSNFHFRLVFAPYYVVLLGDLYEQVYQCSDFDSFSWLLGSVDSKGYVLSKARFLEKEFFVQEAIAYLNEQLQEEDDKEQRDLWRKAKKEFQERLDWADEPQRLWYEIWEEFFELGASDVPSCTGPSAQMLIQYEALKVFVRLYQQLQAKQKEAPSDPG